MASNFLSPRHLAVDGNGKPISGAKLYVYTAGTTTPVTTYSDSGLSNAQTSPVVADSNGLFPAIYIASGDYKFRLLNASDVEVWIQDNVAAPITTTGGDVAVVDGGTGASTASAARTNLGAASSADVTALSTSVASVQGQVDSAEVGGTLRELAGKSEVEFGDFASGITPILQAGVATNQTTGTMVDTDGSQVASVGFAPKRATSTILVMASGISSTGSDATEVQVGIFSDRSSSAIIQQTITPNSKSAFSLIGLFQPGSTSTVSLKLRATGTTQNVSLSYIEFEAAS